LFFDILNLVTNKSHLMKNKGFTLIELLVVISIIALLSSIIVTSVTSARTKGQDNAVKAAMKQLAIQAETYRDTNPGFGTGSYGIVDISDCGQGVFNDTRINQMKTQILSAAATGATLTCSTGASGRLWSIRISALKSGITWCIDNSGAFRSAVTNTGGVCQ
jgi:prepilin-type N-terminal cleavage/methylation domain-containing protein